MAEEEVEVPASRAAFLLPRWLRLWKWLLSVEFTFSWRLTACPSPVHVDDPLLPPGVNTCALSAFMQKWLNPFFLSDTKVQ